MESVRAKFVLQSKEINLQYPQSAVKLTFTAVCADEVEENKRFHKYTPWGTITIGIDNPAAVAFFEANPTVYLDFTSAAPKAK